MTVVYEDIYDGDEIEISPDWGVDWIKHPKAFYSAEYTKRHQIEGYVSFRVAGVNYRSANDCHSVPAKFVTKKFKELQYDPNQQPDEEDDI